MPVMHQRKTCVIVGAGVSGLVQAAELIRRGVLKHEQLAILERAEDYGGVWKAAIYVSDRSPRRHGHVADSRSLEQPAMPSEFSTRSAGSKTRVRYCRAFGSKRSNNLQIGVAYSQQAKNSSPTTTASQTTFACGKAHSSVTA